MLHFEVIWRLMWLLLKFMFIINVNEITTYEKFKFDQKIIIL